MSTGIELIPNIQVVRDVRSPEYRRELEKAAREFEGILLAQMFRAMRSTVPEDGLLGRSFGREVYEDLLFNEAAGLSARAGSIGIADMLYRSFVGEAGEIGAPEADGLVENGDDAGGRADPPAQERM